MLLAGFKEIDLVQLQSWMSIAVVLPPALDSLGTPNLRLLEALQILESIEPTLLATWLQALAEALENGQFDMVYDSLLLQGLNKVEQALLLALDTQDFQEARSFLQGFAHGLRAAAIDLATQPPLSRMGEMVALGTEIAFYLAGSIPPAMTPQAANDFAGAFVTNWANAYRAIEETFGTDAAESFTDQVEAIARHIIRQYKAAIIPFTCGPGCQLLKGLSGFQQWAGLPGSDQSRRVEIIVGSITILCNIIQQGLTRDSFDQPWQLVGIIGEDGTPFDPEKHQNAFIVMRIPNAPGQTTWQMWGLPLSIVIDTKGITIVGRGDHCENCAANVNEILNWIEQALAILDRQIPRDILGKPLDRGIVTYGSTNMDAKGTEAALQAIKDRWGIDPNVAILVWRMTPNGLEWECVGGNCQYFKDEELQKMACKEATGNASCDACEGFGCQEQQGNGGNASGGDSSSPASGAAPPLVDDPSECPPGMTCMLSL
ncbi:MAG: hypothetical protein NUW06_07610 [Candidatus Acetothermia bacterium]|nr:hypothetical protein [Candidatus Acetothermia bacterium]MDH7556602.1 hypothetical protein [Candidatus Methanosuratincola sp.]